MVQSIDYFLFTRRISISIDASQKNFSITAIDVPNNAFLIASYTTTANLRVESNEWVNNNEFFSIENCIKEIAYT